MKQYQIGRRSWFLAALTIASAMRWTIIIVLTALLIHSVTSPF